MVIIFQLRQNWIEIVERVRRFADERKHLIEDIKGAGRCLHFKGFYCDKKDCLRFICPIHLKFEEKLKGEKEIV